MSSGTRPSASASGGSNPAAPEASGQGDATQLDLSGQTLADFRILRRLGQGGMGQVYLAEQISLRRKVALKILRPELAASPQALARFKAEAEAVARATHANIVQVYAFSEAQPMPYIALEYVEGRNLKDYLSKKGPPDLLVALSIMRQVASALQRASELGIIHRDIKPENILITRKGEVKVADFGLSRCLEPERPALNLTQSGVTMGTPLYMSPEQVEGKPVDSRTDIYSFGVTCYHMLAGQAPFRGETAFEVAVAHVQKQPPPLSTVRPDLPEALCAIVHKMLAKDPAHRYQTGRDLLRDVVKLRESLSGSTMPPGLPVLPVEPMPSVASAPTENLSPQPTTRKPRGWMIAVVLLSMLAAAGGGMIFAWNERRLQGPLPGNTQVQPADASVVETILLPNKREQALRLLVDQALSPPPGKTPDISGVGNCMELGLFYLEENRLDEAEQLFARLVPFKKPESYRMLGQVGQAIVLALRSKPHESNKLFIEVFAPQMGNLNRLIGPLPVKAKKGSMRSEAVMRKLEAQHLAPIRFLLDNTRARDWLARARLYNRNNGVRDDEVPRYLLWRFPIASEGGKKS